MFRLLRKWFTPSYKEIQKFEYSPSGFEKAKRWAKGQPHPDSEHKLNEINKAKQNVRTVRK